jgi:hypothetical protein
MWQTSFAAGVFCQRESALSDELILAHIWNIGIENAN